jgi:hypothetical protein
LLIRELGPKELDVSTLGPSALVVFRRLVITCFLLGAVFIVLHHANAQSERIGRRMGLPQDWSHRHVIFSRPANLAALVAIRQDPRLMHQLLRRNALGLNRALGLNSAPRANGPDGIDSEEFARPEEPEHLEEQAEENDENADRAAGAEHRHRHRQRPGGADWSVTLGGNGTNVVRTASPAKYSFDVAAAPDCVKDFVVFPTSLAGSAGQASIVAYNQLYSTQGVAGGFCNQNTPAVKWAYRTPGAILSSPVLSLDGSKVAWVARNGVVHVLTVGTTGGNGISVTQPAAQGTGNNAVDTRRTLSGAPIVTLSSLWVDYTDDVGYVGDDNGVLHKLTGIFLGTPAEVTSGGWPVTLNAAANLNGPVFDSVTRNIFVTDSLGHLSYVREVGSTSGACGAGTAPCVGATVLTITSGGAIADSPIVDSTTGRVFTETGANGTSAAIVQTDTALGSVVTVNVGAQDGTAGNALHNGDFDNNYFNDPSTGFYYVCGKGPTNATRFPTLYRIGFGASGIMNGARDAGPGFRMATSRGQCSPATEFFNTSSTTDWLFLSVNPNCIGIGGGCLFSFNITAGMPAGFTARRGESAGTSGIVADNVSPLPQASSIYFSNEANALCGDGISTGGCAIKVTQAGLQ